MIVGVLVASFVIGVVLAGLILLGLVGAMGAWLVLRFSRSRASSAMGRTDPKASEVSSSAQE